MPRSSDQMMREVNTQWQLFLNSNLVMPVVLRPDAKGKLTLNGIFQVFKLKLGHAYSPWTRC